MADTLQQLRFLPKFSGWLCSYWSLKACIKSHKKKTDERKSLITNIGIKKVLSLYKVDSCEYCSTRLLLHVNSLMTAGYKQLAEFVVPQQKVLIRSPQVFISEI